MAFFKRTREGTIKSNVKIADVYVATCMILSSHYDESGCGPMCVTMHFLAKCKKEEYYELFSGKKLEKKPQSKDGFLCQTFDTPYVEKVEPLTKYLKDSNTISTDIQSLFDFITDMNVLERLGAFSEDEDDGDDETS